MKKLILIDSNALVHRAFHALPPTLTSPKGVLTNAVYGFASVLIKMLKDLKPDYIVATYDLAGPTFRHTEFADYKVHREKAPDELYAQIPLTKEVLRVFGIPVFEKQGFEADDLIGALAEKAKNNPPAGGVQVVIVTGDLDTLQLVEGDKVVVFTLRKGLTDTILYNEKEVINRYGFKPEFVTDFKGLKGDPSDNIPGVPGIGDKTAAMLIQKFGTIENLYKSIAEIKNQKSKVKNKDLSEKLIQKLQENKDQALFSKKLATIVRDIDIDFDINKAEWRLHLARPEIETLFKELGFYSLVKRLAEAGVADAAGSSDSPQKIQVSRTVLNSLKNPGEISGVLDDMASAEELIIDFQGGNIICSHNGRDCYSFRPEDLGAKKNGGDGIWNKFAAVMQNPKIKKIGHNLKPFVKELLRENIHASGLYFDTKIAAYLLKADRKDYEINEMYLNETGQELGAGPENIPAAVSRLKELFESKLEKDGLLKIFHDIEMPLINVLAEMETAGIKIDVPVIKKLSVLVTSELADLEKNIHHHAGIQFNINSPQQLKEVLFERLKIKGRVRKTAKGALSTAAGELEKLAGEHPIIDLILKYRELQKLKTTYIEPFPDLIGESGCLHTTFNQTGTVTGRISSQDPNLQNIPIRTELGQEFRKAFISSPGYQLVSFDYSQLELRIAAHIADDPKMKEAFNRGEDIHTRTAAEIFGVAPDRVTSGMRRQAKVMNFGLIYGMGLLGFQRAAGVSRDRAKEFISRYMQEFEGVAAYMKKMREKAADEGYVSTLFGRRRYLPEINSGIPQLVAQAERMAINMPIQGTEGDFLRIAMNGVYKMIHEKYNDRDVKLLLQVHDELLFEIKEDLVKDAVPQIKEIMEKVCELSVPLTVEVKIGKNWKDMISSFEF